MRVALVIATVTLILALASRSTSALQGRGDASPLKSIRMIDAEIGWATTSPCDPCPPHVVSEHLLRTTSSGTQWTDITPFDPLGERIRIGYFNALDSQIAWATGGTRGGTKPAGVFRTVDGGRTWKGATIPPEGFTSISFINPREGWLLLPLVGHAGHSEIAIYGSTDGGEAWTGVWGGTVVSCMTGITFLNSKTGWITGLGVLPDRLCLYVTHDGGHSWQDQSLPIPPQPQRSQPMPLNMTPRWEGTVWSPNFFTAQDGIMRGDYYHSLFNNSTGDNQGTRSLIVFYITHDGGATWTYTEPVLVKEIGMGDPGHPSSFADMNFGWVKEEDTLFVTSDGGRGWTRVRPNQLFADVTQLDFISPEVGWAVRDTCLLQRCGGSARQTAPFLLKTLNGGRTWIPVTYTILEK